ncbi:MAG: preprotein translocase subunit SecG [Rhizobiales bacterium 62-17]|nr:preprotein translocase subunit SecG [Hyphomicrobiales bacterium]OJY05913.1 MAG: preprotein translocase subunit SecG [Rhizobiales bacterium 62-17]
MDTVLIVIHLMVVIALVVVVLLQRSEGGALGIGGGSGFMTGRGQANALTKATAILGTIFFLTSLALTILANVHRAPRSALDGAQPAGQTAPAQPGQAPASGGSLFDQLQRMETPAAPATPAAPQPPQPGR